MDDLVFRELVDDVRDRTDIVRLVGETIQLKTGGSVLRGRSLRNRDKTPSLVVWPHTQTWRDFSGGGGDGGDCFDFLAYRDGLSFMDALRFLASRAGIVLPGQHNERAAAEMRRIAELRRLQELLTAAARYYHSMLSPAVRRRWYRERYAFTDETVDELLLGWSNGHLFEHFTGQLSVAPGEALATGLFVQLRGGDIKDFFVNRLVFPYWKNGRVVYFTARKTEMTGKQQWEQPKYKKLLTHSPRHAYVSHQIANDTFYNEDCVRHAKLLVIAEGITDCISARQAGYACISPGTARCRHKDRDKLVRIAERVSRIVICNDAEDRGAGDSGAVDTARVLFDAGHDVRIARLPRAEGVDKLDLNEFVQKHGEDELRGVLDSARQLPVFLIDCIPAETPKTELGDAIIPALELVRASNPLLREACIDLIRTNFRLKVGTVKAMLNSLPALPEPKTSDKKVRKGEVFEGAGHYYTLGREGEPLIVSSFIIEPTQRILVDDDGEIIDARVTTEAGRAYDVRFPRDAWNSRHSLLKVLRPVELQWTGSDENVQGVLRLVAARSVPTRSGTINLGYLDTEGGPRWVTPGSVLSSVGASTSEDIVYVPSGSSLSRRVRVSEPDDPRAEGAAAAVILRELLRVNTPEVMLPIIGWFFAAPLKPRITARLGRFPILVVWGTQGSGKSSLIMDVMWPLLGIVSSEPYSATETEFALLKLLSATNSVPVFIDEYKPFDMPRHRHNQLHRYMRRLYTGEVEERGRADQTVNTYHLAAPLCIAGETRPIEPALVERILTANPDKDALTRNLDHARAYARIKSVNPGLVTSGLIQFLLARPTEVDLVHARSLTDRYLGDREVPFRVRDNTTVMMLGLHHFREYAASLGVPIPELPFASAVQALLDDLLEGGGTAVKTGLDYFLEELSIMAVNGAIEHGRHYVYREGMLALHSHHVTRPIPSTAVGSATRARYLTVNRSGDSWSRAIAARGTSARSTPVCASRGGVTADAPCWSTSQKSSRR